MTVPITAGRTLPVTGSDVLASGECNVLVVDDMASIRMVLARQVARLGHSTAQAGNGGDALRMLRSSAFDLVLLDVLMPGMTGYDVLKEIKSDPELRSIPVVMISGLGDLASVVACIEAGADDYLTKPFESALLRARVNTSLEKKRLWDELRARYAQLQELEQLRDSLTHMIVHDLRTPLTALLLGVQTAESAGDLNAIQRECLSMASSGGVALLGMINDLLDVSKMEAGTPVLHIARMDVGALAESAAAQVAPLLSDSGMTVRISVAPDLPPLDADADYLRRVLVNLLGNAIKFSPNGTAIDLGVSVGISRATIQFTVSDAGEGIPREAYARIFDKFGQVQAGGAARTHSTGLGLTFCKLAVEAHGGRIWVESELGRGSCFSFEIPATGRD